MITIDLDLILGTKNNVSLMQFDVKEKIKINVFRNEEVFNLEGNTLKLQGIKSDDRGLYIPVTILGGNALEFEVPEQLTVVKGFVDLQLLIYSENGILKNSRIFSIYVSESLKVGEIIASENDFLEIRNALEKVEKWDKYFVDSDNGGGGIQGPKGDKGEKGDPGIQGPQGIQGPKGDSGEIGPQGPQGPKGADGVNGSPGIQGPKGDTGLQGLQGPKGDTGNTGSIGPTGPKGDTGLTGPQGERGLQGIQGNTGTTGAAGQQGIQGPKGDTGLTGAKGDTGSQGIQGLKGDTGSQGPKGDTGLQGLQGIPGTGLDNTIYTTSISGSILTLTDKRLQKTTIKDGIEIKLPTVTSYTEIHLFFDTTTDLTLTLPNCKWQGSPVFKANKSYEIIFTYVDKWLGGVIEYA